MFSADTYRLRRQKLIDNIDDKGILLFLSNKENPINFEHNCYPFRQDSNFLYYFGIKTPAIVGLIDLEENTTILFGNEQHTDDIIWTGRGESLQEKAFQSGILEVRPEKELLAFIQQAIINKRKIHYLPPYQAYNKILLAQLTNQIIENLTPSATFIRAIVTQRSIKEDQEILETEKALNTTVEMHKLAMRITKPGMKRIRNYQRYASI